MQKSLNKFFLLFSEKNKTEEEVKKCAIETIELIGKKMYKKLDELIVIFLKEKLNIKCEIWEIEDNYIKEIYEEIETFLIKTKNFSESFKNEHSTIEKVINDMYNGINIVEIENIFDKHIIQIGENFKIESYKLPNEEKNVQIDTKSSNDSSTGNNTATILDEDYNKTINIMQELIENESSGLI
ncbi:hypothetical protein EDEG_02070 [Edhazardia aedis USNM 41457]|uniref:Uncharacterized protein n=1 Tax=Edhazardia aedis (strain USNM 41457) TaxID=1003232 RepID=J9DQL6_EDHAE|nr:hypothetical protein EDEG_02070 [Edhazardia aedis USNM 41457]|eukprot:EJW03602.1 hypothetical protein EDEG_02070 [Edhazardia aedis USNM 41457]